LIKEESVMESRLATIARRGLLLPAETREQIRATGIRCRPQLGVVYQQGAKLWKLRGEESGGAVELLGHYVGFVDSRGDAIPWLQRVQNFIPNGIHAIVVTSELVRVEMFRYEKTYDLLITRHWLEPNGNRRPELRSAILFLGRNGSLETELWGKDSAFRGGAMPHFYTRSGEPGGPESMWVNSAMKATEGVCCPGCRHSHLLEATVLEDESEALTEVPA
jgi:hypothetical protein